MFVLLIRQESQSWIMVNFLEPKLLSGIITQGSPDFPRWVERYSVYYSLNGKDFTPYTESPNGRTPYVFYANSDQTTPIRNLFNRDIIAQYIKIVPQQSAPAGAGLRFELLGCNPTPFMPPVTEPVPIGLETTPTYGPPTMPQCKCYFCVLNLTKRSL